MTSCLPQFLCQSCEHNNFAKYSQSHQFLLNAQRAAAPHRIYWQRKRWQRKNHRKALATFPKIVESSLWLSLISLIPFYLLFLLPDFYFLLHFFLIFMESIPFLDSGIFSGSFSSFRLYHLVIRCIFWFNCIFGVWCILSCSLELNFISSRYSCFLWKSPNGSLSYFYHNFFSFPWLYYI